MNEDLPTDRAAAPSQAGQSKAAQAVEAHPVGVIGGGLAGAVGGAISGIAAGPVGSLAGAVGGAMAGAMAGSSTGPSAGAPSDPLEDDWRAHHAELMTGGGLDTFDDYLPAYRFGLDAYENRGSASWTELEPDLVNRWDAGSKGAYLPWESARLAAHAAWNLAARGVAEPEQIHGDSKRISA